MRKKNRAHTKANIKSGFHRKKKTNQGKYVVNDAYSIKARKAGYRARSIYKLLEIQQRFDLIKPHFSVMDVGCAPGSFLQAIRHIVTDKIIIGIDLQSVTPLPYSNIKTIVGDICNHDHIACEVTAIIGKDQFDLITSDIAPNTTGRFDVDQYASVELNIEICKLSDRFLKPGGNMLLKVFKGQDFHILTQHIKKRFASLKTYKPLACRHSSHEEYIICLHKI